LVSIGTEGSITDCQEYGNKVDTIDYITFHAWAQNWGWYSPTSKNPVETGIK